MNELDGTVTLAHRISLDHHQDDIFEFIMALDLAVADLSFTERLYAALGDAIRAELEEL